MAGRSINITRRQGMTRQDAESRGWSWENGVGTLSYTVNIPAKSSKGGIYSLEPPSVDARHSLAAAEVQPPSTAGPAQGDLGGLCGRQQAAVIGQAVPIVFARRVGDRGGVFITPPATDARYENDASNNLTASYHLILGDGPMGSVQVRDVYQCTCRVGSFTQTYNRRAGNWDPGNFLIEREGYTLQNVPDYCGSKGTCEGLSTMSYENTYPDGSGDWALEVQVFIREGRTVTRLADSVSGPSSNFADLFKLAMETSAKLPADMIDTARLQTTALFLDANQLYCDVNLKEVGNLDDFISANAPYFLVRETRVDGKRGLRPLLPIDGSYAIKTDPIPWEFEFNEEFILPGSLQVEYTPLEQRKPKLMLGMWRQQPGDTFGVTRTAEVGYAVDRSSNNVEQHDMSTFCTHELHAVRAMAYRRARQKWSTHTIAWACRPEVYNRILEEGDIVRVTFQRNASDGSTTTHDYLYELDQIEKTSTGEIVFQATHFPIDAAGRSLVALTVAQAETQGVGYEDNIRTGIDCDENSSTDTSVPAGVGQSISSGDPAEQPPLTEFPEDEEPPPEPPPGGYPPPSVPPAPIPTPPDDPVDPCEPECTSGSICGEVGEPAPTCPAGTIQVGIITAHQPDGDQTCVICEDCLLPADVDCYPLDCCTPEQIAAGFTCVTRATIRIYFYATTTSSWVPLTNGFMTTSNGSFTLDDPVPVLDGAGNVVLYVYTWRYVDLCGVARTIEQSFVPPYAPNIQFKYERTPEIGFDQICTQCV